MIPRPQGTLTTNGRIFAILLTIFALSMLPPSVWAEETPENSPADTETTTPVEILTEKAEPDSAATYLTYKDAVFLVNQAVFLDGSQVKNVELFKTLERAMGKPLLDQYFPITNGTAFLINENGYLITAFHVIKRVPTSTKKTSAQWSFFNYVAKYILPGALSRKELNIIIREYLGIVGKSDVYITVKGSDKREYLARIVDQKENLDLALLKIDITGRRDCVPVREYNNLKVGDPMVTIGYPLTFVMDQFLDDFKSTITNGIVSALRNDAWDIQHTASINPGNSGGPLFTPEGVLVGVNVGTLNNANNIYFAVNVNKLTAWLKTTGHEEFIRHEENQ